MYKIKKIILNYILNKIDVKYKKPLISAVRNTQTVLIMPF